MANVGKAFEIAFIYTAASGAATYEDRLQESLRKVITKDITSIDVAFVMDVTGSIALTGGMEMAMPGDNLNMKVKLHVPVAMEEGLRFAIN